MIILFGIYHQYVDISSDTTTTLPMSLDLLRGNLLLSDWVLGTNNFYFTEIVIYAIGKLLGFSNLTLIYWIPGIAWTILFFATLKFLESEIEDAGRLEKIWFVLFEICSVLIIAPTSSYTLLNANSHNNLYAFMMIYLLLISAWIETERLGYLVWASVLGALLCFSEGVTMMTLIAPMLCVCVLNLLKKDNRKTYICTLISLFSSYICGKIIFKIFDLFGGMYTRGLPVGLSDVHEIPGRINAWINQFLVLLGIPTYFDSQWNIKKIVVTVLMILYIIAVFYYTCSFWKLCWKKQFLLFAVCINLAACIFTDVACHHRYIVIGYYFGFFLLGLFFVELCRKLYHLKTIALSMSTIFILAFAGLKMVDVFSQEKKNINTKQLADIIIDNDLGDGYADFWCASVVSFYTNYDNQILPIYIRDDTGIIRYDELIQRHWYNENNVHYIITYADGRSIFIDTASMLELCGKPDLTYSVGEYELYYWTDDISKYLNNGLADMQLTPYELYHNELVEEYDGKDVLHSGGIVYGPYDDITQGIYKVTYSGENMDVLSFDVWSGVKNTNYDISIVEQTETNIVYTVDISDDVSDIEFRLFNNVDEDASYSNVLLERIK